MTVKSSNKREQAARGAIDSGGINRAGYCARGNDQIDTGRDIVAIIKIQFVMEVMPIVYRIEHTGIFPKVVPAVARQESEIWAGSGDGIIPVFQIPVHIICLSRLTS